MNSHEVRHVLHALSPFGANLESTLQAYREARLDLWDHVRLLVYLKRNNLEHEITRQAPRVLKLLHLQTQTQKRGLEL